MKQRIVVLDAPSNLGLRPPADGAIPGCYKLSWALRDRGFVQAIKADDVGVLVPPRYYAQWQPGDGDRNALAIADYSVRLADRIQGLAAKYQKVVVLGGDCSILIGNLLGLKRLGRYGLVFIDAHSDFRHKGNSSAIGAVAGEDLAIVTGRGDDRLIQMEGRGPFVLEEDIHVVGIRPEDDFLQEILTTKIKVITSQKVFDQGVDTVVTDVLATATAQTDGFWIHLDMDVVDQSEMPAVDSPETGGFSFALLTDLVAKLFASPKCVGIEVTIFDPDLDPDGIYAQRVVNSLGKALE